jgi:hypothetical protein
MGHSKIETTKNIYGNPLRPGPAQDRTAILKAINQAVSRRSVQEESGEEAA